MPDKDRIRLAEAIWPKDGYRTKWSEAQKPPWPGYDFDPFTDANDDYAVLEWAIKNLNPDKYFESMTQVVGSYCYLHEYRIGYFARAALKVIDETP